VSVCSVGPRVGGTAVRIGACRKAEAVSPKANPPSGNLRSGACRKAEAVNPKANPPSGNFRNGRQKNQLAEGNPEAVHAESGSREPEGQLAEGNPEAGGGRTNPPSGNPEAVRAEKRKP